MMRKSLCCIKLARRNNNSYNVYRTLQTQNETHDGTADIVISGGGMVGTTLACALGNTKKLNRNTDINIKIISD
jgi:NADH dehydrogenase FAD-containing subunit